MSARPRTATTWRSLLAALLVGMGVTATWVALTTDSDYGQLAIGLVAAAVFLVVAGEGMD